MERGVRARTADIAATVEGHLGFETLRPGQEDAVRHVLAGRDTLVVMPTGAGKSAIYRIAALLMDGPTVVVSPLIALQRDQLGTLALDRRAAAAAVNSTIGKRVKRAAFSGMADGTVEFLFLAPEQFGRKETLRQLREARPSLFVVDEAHCISAWGHSFRPDYLRLGAVVQSIGRPVILALTATASETVREEIVERLGMKDPAILVQGFDRQNLHLSVRRFATAEAKRRDFLEQISRAPRPGIVYVATQKRAEELAGVLSEHGEKAVFYHGGLSGKERAAAQDLFMSDASGDGEIIVATNAFGMGVDKPNVRFVFHYDISDSPDAYYQEIGRGGRDGARADVVLFYREADLALRKFFSGGGRVGAPQLESVLNVLRRRRKPVSVKALGEEMDLSRTKLHAALGALRDVGAVIVHPTGEIASGRVTDRPAAVTAALRVFEKRRHREAARLEVMRAYAEIEACRRRFLLRHFGEEGKETCGFCDNCDAGPRLLKKRSREPFAVKSWVVHSEWGKGLVLGYAHDKVRVMFDAVGEKALALSVVRAQQLLVPMG